MFHLLLVFPWTHPYGGSFSTSQLLHIRHYWDVSIFRQTLQNPSQDRRHPFLLVVKIYQETSSTNHLPQYWDVNKCHVFFPGRKSHLLKKNIVQMYPNVRFPKCIQNIIFFGFHTVDFSKMAWLWYHLRGRPHPVRSSAPEKGVEADGERFGCRPQDLFFFYPWTHRWNKWFFLFKMTQLFVHRIVYEYTINTSRIMWQIHNLKSEMSKGTFEWLRRGPFSLPLVQSSSFFEAIPGHTMPMDHSPLMP